MPPKKATAEVSKVTTGDEATPARESIRDGVNIEDYNLPKSIVTRLAKGVLPPNTQVAGNAILAMTKGATVFVSYLATHANEFAQRDGRKTLNPNDVFRALEELEFPDFKPRLEAELTKFNDIQADKRNAHKNKAAASKGLEKATSPAIEGEEDNGDGEPAAKKARIDDPDSRGGDEAQSDPDDENEEGQDDDDVEDDGEDAMEVDGQIAGEEGEEEDDERSEDEALDNGDDSD